MPINEQLRARTPAWKPKQLMTLLKLSESPFTERSSRVSFVHRGLGLHFVSIQWTLSSGTSALNNLNQSIDCRNPPVEAGFSLP
jgi:hypothetical protein